MPWLTLPVGLAIAGLASTGVTTGLSLADAPGGDLTAQQKQFDTQQATANKNLQLQQSQLDKQVAPDVQSETGGSLSDAPFAAQVGALSGQPGNLQNIMRAIFGDSLTSSGPGGSGSSGSGGGLTDILEKLRSGGLQGIGGDRDFSSFSFPSLTGADA
jgi:hypothetical protein